jgi:hypothetical protein
MFFFFLTLRPLPFYRITRPRAAMVLVYIPHSVAANSAFHSENKPVIVMIVNSWRQ